MRHSRSAPRPTSRSLALLACAAVGCGTHSLLVGEEWDAGSARPDGSAPRDIADASRSATYCVPGEYRGHFDGTFVPGALGVKGIIGPLSTSPEQSAVSFAFAFRIPPAELPGTALQLEAVCMRQLADDGGLSGRDETRIDGDLRCDTGELVATFRGTYFGSSVGGLGLDQERTFYRGTLSGRFDPPTRSFVEGAWAAREPPVALGDTPGGSGTWGATLASDEHRLDGPLPPCMGGARFPDELFDGGTGP